MNHEAPRLCSLLAVRWIGFEAFAKEASTEGVRRRLARFAAVCLGACEPRGGAWIENPVKDGGERRIFAFPAGRASLEAVEDLAPALAAAGFDARFRLHAGECFRRAGTWMGVALSEVRDLSQKGDAGLEATEAFRLIVPGGLPGWSRRDRPVTLAGTAWVTHAAESAGG